MTRPAKAEAMERIRTALDAIPELKQQSIESHDFKKWRRATRLAIENTFTEDDSHSAEFRGISFFPSGFIATDELRRRRHYQKTYMAGLQSASALLESMIDEINNYWDDDNQTPSSNVQDTQPPSANEVFLVHGRDEGTKNTAARFLEQLDLQAVILADRPSKGLTIIEKVEQHSQVAFAVVLLTPDDTGSLQSEDNQPNPRARQNVIFEMGFFIGTLGRDRVCALTKDVVEIPSDYAGVLYIPLDESEGWKLALVRELQKAGLAVDANQAI